MKVLLNGRLVLRIMVLLGLRELALERGLDRRNVLVAGEPPVIRASRRCLPSVRVTTPPHHGTSR